jgi:phytoene dehydrogenase-like protein
MKFDCIIIGGGFSAMAAAIRLAHFGKKVCVCEKHYRLGGLNSWYSRNGFEIDSGLHAMTNFAKAKSSKSLPLKKLLRQLRIPYDALKLREQYTSKISFPNISLEFTNDFLYLVEDIADKFPDTIDLFLKFDEFVKNFNALNLSAPFTSAREIMTNKLKNSLLVDMLLCPLSYYGSAVENDMDFSQFTIMYKSIFHEGFSVPGNGIKSLLKVLTDRFTECGGKCINLKQEKIDGDKIIALNAGVKKIISKNEKVQAVELENGQILETDKILSSAGLNETKFLAKIPFKEEKNTLAFTESIAFLEKPLPNITNTIIFFNKEDNFHYERPSDAFNTASGVICFPKNYKFQDNDSIPETQIRITLLANYDKWAKLPKDDYDSLKKQLLSKSLSTATQVLDIDIPKPIFSDTFTPITINRFTGHFNGAIYGTPKKNKQGTTNLQGLFICGTDQGFLGITGAMLSGISMANMHILQ